LNENRKVAFLVEGLLKILDRLGDSGEEEKSHEKQTRQKKKITVKNPERSEKFKGRNSRQELLEEKNIAAQKKLDAQKNDRKQADEQEIG
jgi:hypothetical protein